MSSRAVSANMYAQSVRGSSACCADRQSGDVNDLLVSSRNFQMHNKIWRRDQYGRIKSAARVATPEETQQRLTHSASNRQRLDWECEQRKKFLREIDKRRRNSANRSRCHASVRSDGVAAALSETPPDNKNESEPRLTTKGATVITKPPSVMDVQSKSTREPPNSDRRRQECIKDILVPTYNPRVYPRIWRREEIDRIKSASRVVTKQERQQQIEQNELNRERLERESEQRKKMLQAIDKQRQAIAPATPKLPHSDDEEEDPVQVLDRAYLAQQERTQEVMRVNRMILATKCQVVREAQIAEKQEITRSLRDEELQVEKNILNDCDVAIKEEQAQREEKKKINEKFADELREQLKRRDLIKFLEAQRIEEEANANAIAKESLTEDLQRQTQEKKERIAKLREDLKITCELSELQRHMTFEEQRVAEMKAQEYMRKLAERDTELKKEKRLIQEQKQREADRLLVRQTKFLESKSEKEEMKLRLLREEKDREYRKREKEAAVRRKRMEQQLFTDRGAQVDEMKRQREQQTVEEEQLHKQTVAKLREEEEKTRAEAERLKGLKLKYRHEILKQINEKSTVTKEKKQQMMNELHLDKQKEEIRKKALELVIDHKINAMRQANIPENMVRDVERQIKAEETIKFRANVK